MAAETARAAVARVSAVRLWSEGAGGLRMRAAAVFVRAAVFVSAAAETARAVLARLSAAAAAARARAVVARVPTQRLRC